MPRPDSTAAAALAGTGIAPAYFIFLDIVGDPLRFTTYGVDTVISGSGDSELDGTYPAFGGPLIDISDISNSENGSDSLTVSLSGIVSMDTTLLNEIGDKSKWQGRLCRLWCRIYDESGVNPQGAIFSLYTGYMSSVRVGAEPKGQTIQLSVENWLAAFNQPSNRTYQNQADYDATDTSAAASLAASNGMRREAGGARPRVSGRPDWIAALPEPYSPPIGRDDIDWAERPRTSRL